MQSTQKEKHKRFPPEYLQHLDGKKKLQYIWDYYKLPLIILCITFYIIAHIIYGKFTHKDVTLYAAFVNIAAGEELTAELSDNFLITQNINTSKNRFYLYSGLYLTNDSNDAYFAYTYASRMKILAAIDSEQLDIVLMNKSAFDIFSQSGYLCDLDQLLAQENPSLHKALSTHLVANTAIRKDNSLDLYFDPSIAYCATTETYPMGVNLSQSPLIQNAGFEEAVYLGIIANSPRKDSAVSYLQYLLKQ